MRGLLLFLLLNCLSSFSFCQVAINKTGSTVTDTSAMLEVKKAIKSKVRIASSDINDTAQLELSNRNAVGSGTDFLITAKKQQGLYFSSASSVPGNNNDSLLVLLPGGKIGIGRKTPSYTLDVNGDVNMNSPLRINGNAGAEGQVLTASGTGAPQWKTAALSNNVRFFFKGASQSILAFDFVFNNTIYNTDTVAIVRGNNSITINKTGLYHFDGTITVNSYYYPAPSSQPYHILGFNCNTGGNSYSVSAVQDILPRFDSTSAYQWYVATRTFNFDLYVTAGTVITPSPFVNPGDTNNSTVTASQNLSLRGYLISE